MWRALVEHAVEGIVVLDREARVTYASPSAARLAGVAASDWVGRSALELIHPADLDAVATSFANTTRTPGEAVPLRFRILRAAGGAAAVEAVATNLLDQPEVGGIVVSLRDLADREEAVTALEAGENRFRRLLENISDTVTVIDDSGRVVDTTGNVKSILGYDTSFWADRTVFDVIHPDDAEGLLSKFAEVLAEPAAEVMGEFRVRSADGTYVVVEGLAVNLLHDPDVRGIVLTTRNVTERKAAELELAAARDAAVRALEVRTEFVASVSHELRTPIHGVLGLAELLASNELDEDSASLVRSIQRATESLRIVLDDVLDFAKIEAGRLDFDLRPTPLTELVDDVCSLLRPQASAKGVDLRVVLDEGLPVRVQVDPLRVRQVLTNLLGNAVKFTAAGSVTVAVRREGEWLVLEVADTGIGIADDALERIFEPFSQAHMATAREHGGTGLGLTISRRLVEMMGGHLAVRSRLGEGTTMTASLPLHPVPAVPETTGGRVLIVEDNPVNQLLVSRQLERLGYDPLVAESGAAALAELERGRFDVVLMDWRMPDLDGLETTRLLRDAERATGRPRVPVLGMTANVLQGDRDRCLDAGMDEVIAKPVNLATLGRALATWTATSGAPSAPGAPPPFDRGAIDRLLDELEDDQIVATVIATYLRELDTRVVGIEDAARTGDRDRLRLVAHTLASTSATVGAVALADLCRTIERGAAADVEPAAGVESVLASLRALAAAAASTLGAIHGELTVSPS